MRSRNIAIATLGSLVLFLGACGGSDNPSKKIKNGELGPTPTIPSMRQIDPFPNQQQQLQPQQPLSNARKQQNPLSPSNQANPMAAPTNPVKPTITPLPAPTTTTLKTK